jgi:hypothetical protein
VTDRVCRDCNQRAGREIDAAIQNDWLVAQAKLLYRVKSSRNGASGKPKTGQMEAHVKGEPDRPVDIGRDWSARLRSSISEEVKGKIRIAAESEDEARRLRERLIKRLESEGRTIQSEQLEHTKFRGVEVKIGLDGAAWLRAAAKMFLATLSLCVDEAWLDSDDAGRLRRSLWEAEPQHDDGSPAFAVPVEPVLPEGLVAPAPSHLITIMPSPTSHKADVVVSVGLFGRPYVRIGVQVPTPAPDNCWLVLPGKPPTNMSWTGLLDDAARRYIEQNADPEA